MNSVNLPLEIGILALHGAFKEHKSFLASTYPDLNITFVKNEEQLLKTDGLMYLFNNFHFKKHQNNLNSSIPGGESTTMGLLAEKIGLIQPMRNYIRSGKPIFGTCAGLILLSDNFVYETLMVFKIFFYILVQDLKNNRNDNFFHVLLIPKLVFKEYLNKNGYI